MRELARNEVPEHRLGRAEVVRRGRALPSAERVRPQDRERQGECAGLQQGRVWSYRTGEGFGVSD